MSYTKHDYLEDMSDDNFEPEPHVQRYIDLNVSYTSAGTYLTFAENTKVYGCIKLKWLDVQQNGRLCVWANETEMYLRRNGPSKRVPIEDARKIWEKFDSQ